MTWRQTFVSYVAVVSAVQSSRTKTSSFDENEVISRQNARFSEKRGQPSTEDSMPL